MEPMKWYVVIRSFFYIANWPDKKTHNAPFRTELCTLPFWMVHCGIWITCGFVRLACCHYRVWSSISGTGLTRWGRVTHICVVKLTIIGSDNGLSPGRCQAIIWTNAGILLIGPLGTNFSEILIGIQTFSFKKMDLKMSSAKWRPFCLGLNELNDRHEINGSLPCWSSSLTIFRSNSKFDQNLQGSDLKCTLLITTKFCTRHDSYHVVTYAKFRCDQ